MIPRVSGLLTSCQKCCIRNNEFSDTFIIQKYIKFTLKKEKKRTNARFCRTCTYLISYQLLQATIPAIFRKVYCGNIYHNIVIISSHCPTLLCSILYSVSVSSWKSQMRKICCNLRYTGCSKKSGNDVNLFNRLENVEQNKQNTE